MAASLNFRNAFNGFNREDVVNYIEYISAKHSAEVNQLNSEIEFLKNRNASAQDPLPSQQPSAAEQENETLRAQISELKERCAALEGEERIVITEADDNLLALEARCKALEAELKAALDAKAAAETAAQHRNVEQELEAYRRAERAERLAQERAELAERVAKENAQRTEKMAQERAELVYHQTNSALADATTKVDAAAAEISAMTETVMAQLAQLQAAVSGSKQTLKDAAATMYAIRPGEEK